MSGNLVLLVLAAAFLHALWNALAKSSGHPIYSIASYRAVAAVICLPLIGMVSFPGLHAWFFIIGSAMVHNLYYFALAKSYENGDLSLVYPLLRGMAPIFVAIGAALFAGETIAPLAVLGIIMVSGGLLIPTLFADVNSRPSAPALAWGLVTGLLIATYTVLDGSGVRVAATPAGYIVWLFVLESVPVVFWLLCTQRVRWLQHLADNRRSAFSGGVAASAAYALVIYAMSLGAMALVSSLRETSVVFAAVIGALFLGESFGRQRIFAAVLVATGVIIIHQSSAS